MQTIWFQYLVSRYRISSDQHLSSTSGIVPAHPVRWLLQNVGTSESDVCDDLRDIIARLRWSKIASVVFAMLL